MPKLTVLIPCKDELQHVRACLESARLIADEIVIADSGSTDGTLDVVRSIGGCRVIEREYVNAADFRNWALSHVRHEWVLVLNADERVTPELAAEIRALFAFPIPCDGYSLRRDNFFLGHPIKHCGWNIRREVRLFRKESSRYQVRRERTAVVTVGNIGRLQHPLLHHPALDFDRFLAKQHRDAIWSALDAYEDGKRASWLRLLTRAPLVFLRLFLLHRGFLDGRAGVVVCGLAAWTIFLKDARLWALRNCRVPASESVTAARAAASPQTLKIRRAA